MLEGEMYMFDNQRYVTRGVSENIPVELQMLMWIAVDNMPVKEKDYLQVFKLEPKEIGDIKMQHVKHSQEMPDYVNEFDVFAVNPVTAKIYVIDDQTHSTMILAEEY